MRPGIPIESSINVVFRNPVWSCASPIGNEEAGGVALDLCPVSRTPDSLKGRDQRLLTVLILRSAGLGGERFDCVCHRSCIPRTAREIIKREKEAKVSNRVRGISRVVDRSGGIRVLWGNVQRETVDANVFSFGDVVGPIVECITSCKSNLHGVSATCKSIGITSQFSP